MVAPAKDDETDMGAMFLVMQVSLTAAIGMIAMTGAKDPGDAHHRLQVMRDQAELMKDNLLMSAGRPTGDEAAAFAQTCSQYLGYIFDTIKIGP